MAETPSSSVAAVAIVILVIALGWGFIDGANHTPYLPEAGTYTTPQGVTHAYGGIMGILGAARWQSGLEGPAGAGSSGSWGRSRGPAWSGGHSGRSWRNVLPARRYFCTLVMRTP